MAGDSLAAPPIVERRLVSVLFADLVGFTAWSAGRDPEDVRDLLSSWFVLARERIERRGGTVEKFIGDAVMAAWGAPIAGEDDAERAVLAALDVVAGVRELGEGIEARAAVTTGEVAVTVGAVGEGMVAGEVVNMASRLQAAADPATVLVGSATMLAASARVAFEPAGDLELKGLEAPVPAWRAIGAIAGPRERDRPGAMVPDLVGRGPELDRLADSRRLRGRGAAAPAGLAPRRGRGRQDPARPGVAAPAGVGHRPPAWFDRARPGRRHRWTLRGLG